MFACSNKQESDIKVLIHTFVINIIDYSEYELTIEDVQISALQPSLFLSRFSLFRVFENINRVAEINVLLTQINICIMTLNAITIYVQYYYLNFIFQISRTKKKVSCLLIF